MKCHHEHCQPEGHNEPVWIYCCQRILIEQSRFQRQLRAWPDSSKEFSCDVGKRQHRTVVVSRQFRGQFDALRRWSDTDNSSDIENLTHVELPIDTPRRYFRHRGIILLRNVLKCTAVVLRPWSWHSNLHTSAESIHSDRHTMGVRVSQRSWQVREKSLIQTEWARFTQKATTT